MGGIELWRSNTVWANQRMCVATLTLDGCGNGQSIDRLKITVDVLEKIRKTAGERYI
ncbi:IrmA family protein [Yersinia intermedia]|uniref:IrmA family protein n=1 Tax=Yersinia intermedia TaxID=631 RepID=UPI003A5C5426